MAQKKQILLIEDEEDIAVLLKLHAEAAGYRLHVEMDGINGYRAIAREKPNLVILDLMLPGENGLDVCRKAKANPTTKNIPILILSAKGEELDVALGLELGADDYVSKPFSPKVLFARVKAILRRTKGPRKVSKIAKFGEFTLDIEQYALRNKETPIPLTLSEFGILKRLATNPGKVLTRNQLLEEINPDDSLIVDRNIDVHIASLRKKLGASFQWLETVRGVGYRFREESVPKDAERLIGQK